ncbi:unnamed protein product, partial [Closterium sp. NIES-53]
SPLALLPARLVPRGISFPSFPAPATGLVSAAPSAPLPAPPSAPLTATRSCSGCRFRPSAELAASAMGGSAMAAAGEVDAFAGTADVQTGDSATAFLADSLADMTIITKSAMARITVEIAVMSDGDAEVAITCQDSCRRRKVASAVSDKMPTLSLHSFLS